MAPDHPSSRGANSPPCSDRLDIGAQTTGTGQAARKRAAIELIATQEATLRRTARRYSLGTEDAEDAYQRALEIVLTKAPTTDPRELIRWTQTVTKHEALAVRQSREKLLGGRHPARRAEDPDFDPIAQLRAPGDSPEEQAERREAVARGREALRALKPAELRALGLLAEGYSYAEIGELTGYSRTKVNRLLAEGRERFRGIVAASEDGTRCRQLRPLLSAFCDGEAVPRDAEEVREHLRACAHCRATMRSYRAAPRIAAAFAPLLPLSRTLPERARDLLAEWSSRLPGSGGGGEAVAGVASGAGAQGVAATAKLMLVCAGAAGGTAACVATGVMPDPLAPVRDEERQGAIVRIAEGVIAEEGPVAGENPVPREPARAQPNSGRIGKRSSAPAGETAPLSGSEYEPAAPVPAPSAPAPPAAESAPPAPTESAPAPEPAVSASPGSAAGEFGP